MDDHTILPYHIIEVKLGVNPFYIVSRPKTAWNTPFLVLYYQGQTWGHPSTSYRPSYTSKGCNQLLHYTSKQSVADRDTHPFIHVLSRSN